MNTVNYPYTNIRTRTKTYCVSMTSLDAIANQNFNLLKDG